MSRKNKNNEINNGRKVKLSYDPSKNKIIVQRFYNPLENRLTENEKSCLLDPSYFKMGRSYDPKAMWHLIPHLYEQGYIIEASKEVRTLEIKRNIIPKKGGKGVRLITTHKEGIERKIKVLEEKRTIDYLLRT